MAEVMGPTIYFDAQIKGLEGIQKGFKDAFSKINVDADKIGRSLDKATEGMERMRQQVDQTVDPLRMFGKRGIELANAIDDITDPARRSAIALRELRAQANPDALQRFNNKLNDMGAELEMAKVKAGPLGLAIGAVTGAVVAGLAAMAAYVGRGLKLLVDESEEAQRRLKILESRFDDLNKAVASAVIGHADLADAMAGLDKVIDDVDDGIRSLSQDQFGLEIAIDAVVMGLKLAFPALGLFSAAMKVLAEIGATVPPLLKNVGSGLNDLVSAFGAATDAAFDFFNALPRKVTGGLGGIGNVLKGWADAGGEAQLRAAERQAARAVEAATRRGGGGGGRSKTDRAKQLQEESAALVGVLANDLDLMMERARESFKVKFMAPLKAQAQALLDSGEMDGLAEIGKRNLEALQAMDAQAMVMDAQFAKLADGGLSIAINGFIGLADAVSMAMGEFLVGAGSLKEFGKSLLQAIADMASQFGSLFLLMGTGFQFIPGLQPAGGGLIAAGLGLKVLAGALGAVAAGGAGGGRGSGRGGGAAAVDPSRFMRPERDTEPSVTNLKVVILGEEIERPVTRFIDDVARRGGFRNLATRT
jgi:hypothetical protein